MSLQNILAHCELSVTGTERVHGGDINDAWRVRCRDASYFLKVNDAKRFPAMFEKEANGLDALRRNCNIAVPRVIRYGLSGGQQYLLLEWLEKGAPQTHFWENFGTALAMLHRHSQPLFGWIEHNYIGSLSQINLPHDSWACFYCECRIMPLVKQLRTNGSFWKTEVEAAENFCGALGNLFPSEPPALLHGDLWSGNFMVAANGQASIYDPAVYFGHREMDIGMTKLFGGFDPGFYRAYANAYPLEKDWEQRLPFTQLYPLLVHAVLFGGHYINKAREIILRFA